MRNKSLSSGQHRTGGRRLAAAFCNAAGILILISVIATCLPVTVPKLLGYEIYHVVSGSMEPEIPVGSVIYVEAAPPESISEGEIIAFDRGDSVVVHRVADNQIVEGEFITKGDANEKADVNSVPYASVIGRVKAHYPLLGKMLVLYTSNVGKIYAICFAVCGAMFNILASRLRERDNQERIGINRY
jgi:signal peptidase I